jgi:Na+/phosphate symporter
MILLRRKTMEEREITDRINKLFEETVPILHNIYKGFAFQKIDLLKESQLKFRESLKKRLPGIEKLVEDKDKDEVEKRFVIALPHLQRVALALDNLVDKMEAKVKNNVLFNQKALDEIKQIMVAVGAEFTDVKDYCMTKNPHLKKQIRTDIEKVAKMIDDFDVIHQNRLISGVCAPQASYLYIDMTDSLKRMARELLAFSDKA